MPEIYVAILLWLALQTVFLIAAWARMETRMGHMADSLQRLWKSHDSLHPRSANPGERKHNGHNHDEEE